MRTQWAGFLAGLALACSPEDEGNSTCSFPTDIGAGTGEAVINGDDWEAAGVAWSESGSGLQITTAINQGWRLTLVVQGDAIDSDGLGIVDLGGSGGWGLVYPEEGSSYSSQEGGGTLELVSRGDTVELCLELEAEGEDGELVLEEGYLHASVLDLGR